MRRHLFIFCYNPRISSLVLGPLSDVGGIFCLKSQLWKSCVETGLQAQNDNNSNVHLCHITLASKMFIVFRLVQERAEREREWNETPSKMWDETPSKIRDKSWRGARPVLCCVVLCWLFLSCRVPSCLVLSCLTLSYAVVSPCVIMSSYIPLHIFTLPFSIGWFSGGTPETPPVKTTTSVRGGRDKRSNITPLDSSRTSGALDSTPENSSQLLVSPKDFECSKLEYY